MKRMLKRPLGHLMIACVLALAPVTALAHAHLDHAQPAVDSTVAAAPKDVTLFFTEAVEPMFSSVVVHDAKGTAMQDGKAVATPDNTAALRVKLKALPPGVYTVIWRILSVDTHRTEGQFKFTVGP